MIQHLKRGGPEQDREQDDVKVRAVVEATLSEIERRGDAAVRELAEKFDRYSPPHAQLRRPLPLPAHETRQRRQGDRKLGRTGVVEDIMGAVAFLASDASALVTGTALMIDGGWTAD